MATARPSSDVAFTTSVKAVQERLGSRKAYARLEARGGWATELDDEAAAFIGAQTGCFLATASADGQPYIQHRGDAVPERAIVIRVAAWDVNCPQHIPQRLDAADVEAVLTARDRRIAELEAALAARDRRIAELEAA